MNIAATLPLAAASCGSSCSSEPLPAGFTDVLAAQSIAGGAADADADAEAGHGAGDFETGGVGDLLALAALASRTAHAALPHVTVPATPVGDASTVEDAALAETVVLADETATIEHALTEGAVPGVVPAGDAGDAGDANVDEAASVPVAAVGAAPAGAEGPATAVDPQAGSTDAAVDVTRTATADTATGATTETEASGSAPVEGAGTEASAAATPAADGDDAIPAVVPTVASTDGSEGSETSGRDRRGPQVGAAASDRGPAEAAGGARAAGDGAARAERIDAVGQTVPTQPTAPGRADPVTPSAAAQRVLDIVTQLEDAPPPRVVVIETGEIRLRVGLDAGVVRLTVLGTVGEGGEEVLREAADALEAGGFGTELDRGQGGGDQPEGHDPRDRSAGFDVTAPARPSSRPRAGLQL